MNRRRFFKKAFSYFWLIIGTFLPIIGREREKNGVYYLFFTLTNLKISRLGINIIFLYYLSSLEGKKAHLLQQKSPYQWELRDLHLYLFYLVLQIILPAWPHRHTRLWRHCTPVRRLRHLGGSSALDLLGNIVLCSLFY